ncbi:MAG: S8 family serine peptidase [Candidatus Sericytochromatia bacterium]|nr:S8 family serine peptidase [Candidatus Sericytochromatia bacterium]
MATMWVRTVRGGTWLALAASLVACGRTLAPAAALRGTATAAVQAIPGQVLVSWRKPDEATAVLSRLGAGRSAGLEGGRPVAAPEVVTLPAGMDARRFADAAGDAVAWVEPDRIVRLPEQPKAEGDGGPANLPASSEAARRKPAASRRWWLEKIRAADAWRVTRGKPDVRIGVVDTGVDLSHPALREQVVGHWRASGLLGRLGVGSARDDNGHGTHCAGIAAASGEDGLTGLAPGCKLLVVKALDRNGAGATSDIVRGIRWAVASGARVLSLSVGGQEPSQAMVAAVAEALKAGVVVVAAMGNEGKALKNYPAAIPGVIAVGATSRTDKPASFSTRGPWISVAAPGVDIWSTAPTYAVTMSRGKDAPLGVGEGKLSGTSMATPMVAGLAALIVSAHPAWTPAQVKAAIVRGVVPLGDGFNARTGHGRIDAGRTLGRR